MATFTPLPLDEARRIGERFGLQVDAVRGLLAGSVNSNYELALKNGERAFLRIFEEQAVETAADEALLLNHLAAHGVITPRPLAQSDLHTGNVTPFIAVHAGKPVAVFPWIEGEILCQKRVTPDAVSRVGGALARVHLAGSLFRSAPASRYGAPQLEARLRAIPREGLEPELASDVDLLARELAAAPRRAPESSGIIHGDLFRDNVLWSGPELVAILDFESASRGSPMFDLGVAMLAWCYGDALDGGLCRALAQGYAKVRPIPDDEKADLFYEARFAALRFAVTRITDYERRAPGTTVYKDYRRMMARLRALDGLGGEGLVTLLGL